MTRAESVLGVPDLGSKLLGRRGCMMRGLFVYRWGRLLKDVDGLDPAYIMGRTDDAAKDVAERHLLEPVVMRTAKRHVAAECYAGDDAIVRFAVPFGGHADAIRCAHEQLDAHRPESEISDGPGSDEYRPGLPPGPHVVVRVAGKWSEGAHHFEVVFEKWSDRMERHLRRVNSEISDFNYELPELVRNAVSAKAENMRRADTLATVLTRDAAGGCR